MCNQSLVIGKNYGSGVALPPSRDHVNRVEIKSSSSFRTYIVAQRVSNQEDLNARWECSCPGWRTRRTCKHLKSMTPILIQNIGGKTAIPMVNLKSSKVGEISTKVVTPNKKVDFWKYQKYDENSPVGKVDDWIKIAEDLCKVGKNDRHVKVRSTGRISDLNILGLDQMPSTLIKLKNHVRTQVFMKVHPDLGGTNELFREANDAFKRLMKHYSK